MVTRLVFVRGAHYAAALCCILALLAACGHDRPVPNCPQVRVDTTTATLTKFRSGDGHDLTDVAYEVQMLGYQGYCQYKKNGVQVDMDIAMDVASGPALKPGPTPIYYFIAIPQYFPDPKGKRIMTVTPDLKPGTGRRTRITEHNVHVFIPLKKEEPGAAYDVYIGLQLTPDELAYNRGLESRREATQ